MEMISRTCLGRVHLGGDLLGGRLAAALLETALSGEELALSFDHVHREADRAGLVGQSAGDRLADPPVRQGREPKAAPVVELLNGDHEAEVALLDQVEQGQPTAVIALGDAHHEAQIGLDHGAFGQHVVGLDALGQGNLLGGRQQRYAADLRKVGAHGVD